MTIALRSALTETVPVPAWLIVLISFAFCVWCIADVLRVRAWNDLFATYQRLTGWRPSTPTQGDANE